MEDFIRALLINGIATVLLFMIFVNASRSKQITPDQKMYKMMLVAVFVSICMETFTFWIDKQQFVGAYQLNRIANGLLFATNPFCAIVWVYYSNYKIFRRQENINKKTLLLLIPAILNFVLGITTIFVDLLFKVDPSTNTYERSPLILITYFATYFYILYAMIVIIKNKKMLRKGNYLPMLLFPLPAILFTTLQMVFVGYSLIWIGCTFSALLVYFQVQNDMAKTDFLTGLGNRMQFEEYLTSQINKKSDEKLLVGVMVDINHFKSINDTFGHSIGDDALESAGDIFKKTLNYCDFIARFGGDEFIFILHLKEIKQMDDFMKELQDNTDQFNQTANKPYKLDYSIGYAVFEKNGKDTMDSFIKRMDTAMYNDKYRRRLAEESCSSMNLTK